MMMTFGRATLAAAPAAGAALNVWRYAATRIGAIERVTLMFISLGASDGRHASIIVTQASIRQQKTYDRGNPGVINSGDDFQAVRDLPPVDRTGSVIAGGRARHYSVRAVSGQRFHSAARSE